MRKSRKTQAFTMVEMMIVLSIIAILMAATFRLMRAASQEKKIAETRAKITRIQNALSGYYAQYGQYPPVPFYTDQSPENVSENLDSGDVIGVNDWEARADACARSQPLAYEYPTPSGMKTFIPRQFELWGYKAPNDVWPIDDVIDNIPVGKSDWKDVKLFKFGLLSFLIPRLETAYYVQGQPQNKVFTKEQWLDQNPGTKLPLNSTLSISDFERQVASQRAAENEACAKWLPHLEGLVCGGHTVLGINLAGSGTKGWLKARRMGAPISHLVAVLTATIVDGWDRELYYWSQPPYLSYRIWSAGPDGKTYPPWIDSGDQTTDYGKADRRKKIAGWTKDDIVGGSM